jgi:hypothetical protein
MCSKGSNTISHQIAELLPHNRQPSIQPVLATLDKLLLLMFTLGSFFCAFLSRTGRVPYPDPMLVSGLDNIGTRKNVSLTGGLLFLAGMALGYPLALVISGAPRSPMCVRDDA